MQNISRTSVAISALALAVAATVGVGTMVSSFRITVLQWLESRLNADIFITAPSLISRSNTAVLSEDLLPKLKLEIVTTDSQAVEIVGKIMAAARTGNIGDGKVFVQSIENAFRIRTGEEGDEVL